MHKSPFAWFHFRKRDLLWMLLRSLFGLSLLACGGSLADEPADAAPTVEPCPAPDAATDAGTTEPDAHEAGARWCLECDPKQDLWYCYPLCQAAGGVLHSDGFNHRCCGTGIATP